MHIRSFPYCLKILVQENIALSNEYNRIVTSMEQGKISEQDGSLNKIKKRMLEIESLIEYLTNF